MDRTDPADVLQAYFDAWERGDSSEQESFMAAKYSGMTHEPVESLEIVELSEVEASSTYCVFDVSFDIVVRGQGLSMTTGRYDWSYELTWDEDSQAWIITNYGQG